MPSQLLQSLQNLLNNQNNKINLLTKEYRDAVISEPQNKSFENLFLILSISLTIILSTITYINYNLSLETNQNYNLFKDEVANFPNTTIDTTEIIQNIDNLKKFQELNSSKSTTSEFFFFLSKINSFLASEQLVQINYIKNNNKFDYELVINSSKNLLEQELNSFFRENLTPNQVEKINEVTINPEQNLKQYIFKGTYELR